MMSTINQENTRTSHWNQELAEAYSEPAACPAAEQV
jgi:hypothetical protein